MSPCSRSTGRKRALCSRTKQDVLCCAENVLSSAEKVLRSAEYVLCAAENVLCAAEQKTCCVSQRSVKIRAENTVFSISIRTFSSKKLAFSQQRSVFCSAEKRVLLHRLAVNLLMLKRVLLLVLRYMYSKKTFLDVSLKAFVDVSLRGVDPPAQRNFWALLCSSSASGELDRGCIRALCGATQTKTCVDNNSVWACDGMPVVRCRSLFSHDALNARTMCLDSECL